MATRAETSTGTSAFNRAAKDFGEWLYQKRRGRHDERRAEMLARVETFPGGPELLKQAADLGCEINVRRWDGAEGAYDVSGEKPVIHIANTGDPAGMALALWHELRHMKQDAANPGRGFVFGGQLKDPRTAYLLGVMIEADAFTAETLMALQHKKAGQPEYADAMFGKRLVEGPHLDIVRFLRRNPYEGFKDDATFSRALFTHLMTEGLVAYRAQYMTRLGQQFAAAENVGKFRELISASKDGGTSSSPELNALYGAPFASVSPRALATAFLPAQSIDEKLALKAANKAVKNAATMTETEFQAAKDEMTFRAQEYWNKEPGEPQWLTSKETAARERLRKAALSDKPRA